MDPTQIADDVLAAGDDERSALKEFAYCTALINGTDPSERPLADSLVRWPLI